MRWPYSTLYRESLKFQEDEKEVEEEVEEEEEEEEKLNYTGCWRSNFAG